MDFEDFLYELPRVKTGEPDKTRKDICVVEVYALISTDYRIYTMFILSLQSQLARLLKEHISKAYILEQWLADDKQYKISLVIEFKDQQSALDAKGSVFKK